MAGLWRWMMCRAIIRMGLWRFFWVMGVAGVLCVDMYGIVEDIWLVRVSAYRMMIWVGLSMLFKSWSWLCGGRKVIVGVMGVSEAAWDYRNGIVGVI